MGGRCHEDLNKGVNQLMDETAAKAEKKKTEQK